MNKRSLNSPDESLGNLTCPHCEQSVASRIKGLHGTREILPILIVGLLIFLPTWLVFSAVSIFMDYSNPWFGIFPGIMLSGMSAFIYYRSMERIPFCVHCQKRASKSPALRSVFVSVLPIILLLGVLRWSAMTLEVKPEPHLSTENDSLTHSEKTAWKKYKSSLMWTNLLAKVQNLATANNLQVVRSDYKKIDDPEFTTFDKHEVIFDFNTSLVELFLILKTVEREHQMVRVSKLTVRPSSDRKNLTCTASVIASFPKHGREKDVAQTKEGLLLIAEYDELRKKALQCLSTVSEHFPEGMTLDELSFNDSKESKQNLFLTVSGLTKLDQLVADYKNSLEDVKVLTASGNGVSLFDNITPIVDNDRNVWSLNCLLTMNREKRKK